MFQINHIRQIFLDYFRKNGHQIVSSSSLIPQNDPSLMFTNCGMVQFKNVFTGNEKRSYSRAASSQKSVRAGGKHNDLDNVGHTARHHTFFEMLGNFSFADYFKEEAIYYAWNLLTKEFALPQDKLYVTVYHDDDEAIKFWKKIAGLKDDRIIKISTNDNFWSMGDTGPCGPCSEIFYDHGDKVWGGLPGTKEQDGDRYIEIWNLVFMQYEQKSSGERIDLPRPCIDTGMGLERIAAVLQKFHNNYEIDIFKNLIEAAVDIIKVKAFDKNLVAYRVIADHLRSSAFLLADGVMPSNEGRGYVLRRIMRRAMRYVNQLGYKMPLMHKLVNPLIVEMGQAYPELIRAEKLICDVFFQEENKFHQTLDRGLKILDEELVQLKTGQELRGEIAFKLYDTYGFPLDLTENILKEKGILVDHEGFNKSMDEQKTKARAAWSGSGETATNQIWFDIYQKHGPTEFLGYDNNQAQAIILEVIDLQEDKQIIITNQTPFYGESGGQMGDVGTITDSKNNEYKVNDTKKFLGKINAHFVDKTDLKIGDEVKLSIDLGHRNNLKIHHSATHLLHFALREQIGEHITQKGSLVAADHLRFDFSHNKALTALEICKIEQRVNVLIRQNFCAETKIMSAEEAINSGAMALFGEKYDEEVRVVKLGLSTELCGGTHVELTGNIGIFKIISESAIASGIRRIEAICGETAILYFESIEQQLNNISSILKTPIEETSQKIVSISNDNKKLNEEITLLKTKLLVLDGDYQAIELAGLSLTTKFTPGINAKDLRNFVEALRHKEGKSIILAGSEDDGKTSIVIGLSPDLAKIFNSAELVREVNVFAGGEGGGGRPEIAQAGGYNFSKAQDIIEFVKRKINILRNK